MLLQKTKTKVRIKEEERRKKSTSVHMPANQLHAERICMPPGGKRASINTHTHTRRSIQFKRHVYFHFLCTHKQHDIFIRFSFILSHWLSLSKIVVYAATYYSACTFSVSFMLPLSTVVYQFFSCSSLSCVCVFVIYKIENQIKFLWIKKTLWISYFFFFCDFINCLRWFEFNFCLLC